jgi:hypothetical protein
MIAPSLVFFLPSFALTGRFALDGRWPSAATDAAAAAAAAEEADALRSSTAKPAGIEEWEFLAWTFRKPRGSLRCDARRSTEPAGALVLPLGWIAMSFVLTWNLDGLFVVQNSHTPFRRAIRIILTGRGRAGATTAAQKTPPSRRIGAFWHDESLVESRIRTHKKFLIL